MGQLAHVQVHAHAMPAGIGHPAPASEHWNWHAVLYPATSTKAESTATGSYIVSRHTAATSSSRARTPDRLPSLPLPISSSTTSSSPARRCVLSIQASNPPSTIQNPPSTLHHTPAHFACAPGSRQHPPIVAVCRSVSPSSLASTLPLNPLRRRRAARAVVDE
ncbi:hypothetical protein CC78DRAFT_578886 [Lojkania enalia]|uniref:Uncharacterized protein n=1 Tax=Lojkania enalia TaxID=147567 RepID=A0A9P4N8N5_9PLEO|nr:hypothetical protein CC78DRAFT_578886 [Didymosphaeria enalia]